MSTRARHEARWTHKDSTVSGRRQGNRGWVIILGFLAIALAATVAYMEYMRFETVSYELRQCAEPLTEDSTWADVQAAACEPLSLTDGASLTLIEGSSRQQPDSAQGSTWVIDGVAVNSPAHAIEIVSPVVAESGVIAEPTNQVVRSTLSKDASGTRWTGFIGSRGPTEYWLLLTP